MRLHLRKKKKEYLLELLLSDIKSESTVNSYIKHVIPSIILIEKRIDASSCHLTYSLAMTDNNTDFMNTLLTINGVSKANLIAKS